MQIESKRLVIRDFVESDWRAVHEFACQEEILRYEPWGSNSEEDTQDYIRNAIQQQQLKPAKIVELAVTLKTTGELIGSCGIKLMVTRPSHFNLGYIINPRHWKLGYASEAASALIGFAKSNYPEKQIAANCDEGNIASCRVLEKCGFQLIRTSDVMLKPKSRKSRTLFYEWQE